MSLGWDESIFEFVKLPESDGVTTQNQEQANTVMNPGLGPSIIDGFDFDAFLNAPISEIERPHSSLADLNGLGNHSWKDSLEYPRLSSIYIPSNNPENTARKFPRPSIEVDTLASSSGALLVDFAARPFLNDVLNKFKNPVEALRVIDEFQFPFGKDLQQELERGLDRKLGTEIGLVMKQIDHPKQTALLVRKKISDTTAKTGRQPGNISNRRAFLRPKSWGTTNPTTGTASFQYTKEGMLDPKTRLTVSQLSEFIACHPLHFSKGVYDPKHSAATLWIQISPFDGDDFDKCRFSNCPFSENTIYKGQFRVALSEHPGSFQSAGYIHLFCLEHNLNFPRLCKDHNVRPDDREPREGTNMAAITRGNPRMKSIIIKFILSSRTQKDAQGATHYRQTLNYALKNEYLDLQSRQIQEIRDILGRNNGDNKLNNPDTYFDNRWISEEQKAVAKEGKKWEKEELNSNSSHCGKRTAHDDNEDDVVLVGSELPPTKRPKNMINTAGECCISPLGTMMHLPF